jgi:hypothetical protein
MPTIRLGKAHPVRNVREALRTAAARHGLRADFLDAIGKVETDYRSNLVNQTGADAARGGAWGPTQITTKTARAMGYSGPMEEICADPELAAEWTARILAPGVGPKSTLADYCACWNAGRYNADRNNDGQLEELPPGHPTKEQYLPRAIVALQWVLKNPVLWRSHV